MKRKANLEEEMNLTQEGWEVWCNKPFLQCLVKRWRAQDQHCLSSPACRRSRKLLALDLLSSLLQTCHASTIFNMLCTRLCFASNPSSPMNETANAPSQNSMNGQWPHGCYLHDNMTLIYSTWKKLQFHQTFTFIIVDLAMQLTKVANNRRFHDEISPVCLPLRD